MIIRRRCNRNFTVLPNAVLDDERLSAEAMGVLCYLRSRPGTGTSNSPISLSASRSAETRRSASLPS